VPEGVPLRRACLARVTDDMSPHHRHPLVALAELQSLRPDTSTVLVECSRHDLSQVFAVFVPGVGSMSCLISPSSHALTSRSEYAPSRLVTDRVRRALSRLPARGLNGRSTVTALPWSFLPFGDIGLGKRPTPSLPCSAVLHPQVFSTSRRFVPPLSFQPCFMPVPPRFQSSEGFPSR
jgi:hypothetical protein